MHGGEPHQRGDAWRIAFLMALRTGGSTPKYLNIPRQEVVDAANAVEKFLELAGKK